ncbi:uncharacterized protein [Pleurodeles waltl]|uniref:uncharacterized protein isoform X2 n=1 Tax=Pleurodeles waltl TaxID=8319 RepID=UPI003709B5AA
MDPADQLKKEVSCPICLDYFRDPVLIGCGHNFCRQCISRTWGNLGMGPCPQCRAVSQSTPMRPNCLLQTIVGLVRQLHQNREKRAAPGKCPAHEEQLSLFCMEDQRALCVLCTMNFDHLNHCIQPLEAARSETWVSECSLFSGSSSQTLKEVSCESCLCPVADPITPACNHSFCRVCVARSWSCPTCKPVPKATLWSPAVVFGELRELCDITKAEPDPEELEPHCTIHGSASPDSCHDEARCTCIHVTHAEELWDPIWGFSYRTKPPTSFQKVKEIVRTERAKMLSEYRSLRMLVQERKSLNISRLDSMLHSIVRKERKALRDQHDSFTSIFSSIRLSKIERCLHGRADATYHQADIGPTLSASTNKKERTCLRVGKKKMSSSSSDSDLGAEGPVYYGGSMKGSTTLWKKSTLSNTPWLPHEPEWSYASAFPSGTSM